MGIKLCTKENCALERRNYPPGQHGKTRRPRKIMGYALQLVEKQKVRFVYGVLERQFRRYFERAGRMKGVVGENLLSLLERRLDNVIFRMGFARSRQQDRQIVGHGHVQVNGKKVDIASFSVKLGDIVEIREKSRKHGGIVEAREYMSYALPPMWMEADRDNFSGRIIALPKREDVAEIPINEQLIVELYSR